MATLKVNLTKIGDPCSQDETVGQWNLFLCTCKGIFQDANQNRTASTFHYAGHDYGHIPINYGYAEVKDVPPGRYFVFAMQNIYLVGGVIYSNFISHVAVVDICCGCQDYCVTLYNPHLHECFGIIFHLFDAMLAGNKTDAKTMEVVNQLKDIIEKQTGSKIQERNFGLLNLYDKLTQTLKSEIKKK